MPSEASSFRTRVYNINVIPIHIVTACPFQGRPTVELCTDIAENAGGLFIDTHKRIQFSRQKSSFKASIRNPHDTPNVSNTKSKNQRSLARELPASAFLIHPLFCSPFITSRPVFPHSRCYAISCGS